MLAAFLGFAKGGSERYSENIDLQANEASLLENSTSQNQEQTIDVTRNRFCTIACSTGTDGSYRKP